MNNKDKKNLQDSLYNSILPPLESLKPACTKGFHPYESLDILPAISNSEHTRLVNESHTECFRMTHNTPSPAGANFDGLAELQTQCPCEDRRYSVRTSKFKTEGADVRTIVSNVCG